MAGEGAGNMIVRRVTDDLISFSGETSPSKYMKFSLEQKFAESRRDEQAKRDTLNEMIVEALDEIETQETNVEILDGARDGV
nr:hypothetical protein [Tanacetum cinerariifolium]